MTSTLTCPGQDQQLKDRLCRREEGALREVYAMYEGRVFAAARRVVVDRRAAEDVTQEVFLYLWRHADRIDLEEGAIQSFVVMMARRRAIDYVRSEECRRRREERVTIRSITDVQDVFQPDVALEVIAGESRDHRATRVRRAIGDLPDTERVAIDLAYFQGHTLREVATATGSPEGTAKSRVRRALRRLEHHADIQHAYVN